MDLMLNMPLDVAGEESDLAGLAAAGDAGAFDRICRLHAARLRRQAQELCRDPAAAEDLLQETLIHAWRSLGRYNGRCRLFTWLCSILIHRHHHMRRRRWPIPFSTVPADDLKQVQRLLATHLDAAPLPDTDLARTEQARQVLDTLQRLPPKQRAVVHLRFYADESLEGIAAAVGCSVGTVKSRLFHGLERLRRMYTKSFGDLP